MEYIRQATESDAGRIAEIIVFAFRLNFYRMFRDDEYYFGQMQVSELTKEYLDEEILRSTWVYDDGAVKGVLRMHGSQIEALYVEPVLQGGGIGERLLIYAVEHLSAEWLWALEKNEGAVRFYERHGFHRTDERKFEEGTEEYLVKLEL